MCDAYILYIRITINTVSINTVYVNLKCTWISFIKQNTRFNSPQIILFWTVNDFKEAKNNIDKRNAI